MTIERSEESRHPSLGLKASVHVEPQSVDVPRDVVCQLRLFGVRPNLLDGIELRRVGGQELETDVVAVLYDELALGRAVCVEPVPDDEHAGANVTSELLDERHHSRRLEILVLNAELQPRPAYYRRQRQGANHRQPVVPVPGPVHQCLPSKCLGAPHHGMKHEATLVDQDEGSALCLAIFLTHAQVCERNVSTALSSCARARRFGFCGLKPRSCITRDKWWPAWYCTPNSRRRTCWIRGNVHNSVESQAFLAPWVKIETRASRCSSLSLGRLPPCGLGSRPDGPCSENAWSQRDTEAVAQPICSATSRMDRPLLRKATPRRRRASSSCSVRLGRITTFDHDRDPPSTTFDPLPNAGLNRPLLAGGTLKTYLTHGA